MAKVMNDIALDANGDLLISAGDFVMTESTAEHQRQLLINSKGDFKLNPTIAVGLFGYVDDEGASNLVRSITTEFLRDGMDVRSMNINQAAFADNKVKIAPDADYK